MKIRIRKCTQGDLGKVVDIERRSFKCPYTESVFLYHLLMNPDGFLVAQKDGVVVGYVIGIAMGRKGVVISLAVSPEFRRKGIGSRLINEILDCLKSTEEVDVQVRIGNRSALKFYQSVGFKKEGIIKNYYSDGEDAIIMRFKRIIS